MDVANFTISTGAPVFKQTSHTVLPININNNDKPVPTNIFWENFIIGNGKHPVVFSPYYIQKANNGCIINYPSYSIKETFIISDVFGKDVTISAKEISETENSVVKYYDQFSCHLDFNNLLTFYLVKGSPFITCQYNNTTPIISFNVGIQNVVATGRRHVVSLANNERWAVYTDNPITFTNTNDRLTATASYTGYLKAIFIKPEFTAWDKLDSFSRIHVIGGKVDYTVINNRATLNFSWKTTGATGIDHTKCIMCCLPHHRDILQTPTYYNELTYNNLKGEMKIVVGNKWSMIEPLTTIGFIAPRPIPGDDVKSDLLEAFRFDSQNLGTSKTDPYFFGKHIAKLARLVLVGEELGETVQTQNVSIYLKNLLKPWLEGTNANNLMWDNVWKGICSRSGLEKQTNDFGNGWYSDHHFHYGYFIYAAAVCFKRDSNYKNMYKEAALNFVRDIANPSSSDPFFIVTRNKDWYEGHSWAGGIAQMADPRNQESTSEAVNAYYAVYLMGLSLENKALADLGRILLASEIRSAQKYWQIKDTSIYPKPFANNKVVGILWASKVDYTTWFGNNVEFIHCIQMLPFTPISEQLLSEDWIRTEYEILKTAYNRESPKLSKEWEGYIRLAHAIITPRDEYTKVKELTVFDDGNTKTNSLYWIVTRPQWNSNPIPDNSTLINGLLEEYRKNFVSAQQVQLSQLDSLVSQINSISQ